VYPSTKWNHTRFQFWLRRTSISTSTSTGINRGTMIKRHVDICLLLRSLGIQFVIWVCTICLINRTLCLADNKHATTIQQEQQYSTEPIDWTGRRQSTLVSTLPKDLLESSIANDDVGDGEKETFVYVEPKLESMYQNSPNVPSTTKVTPKFNGFAAKFINMSNKPVTLYWYVL
jgi:hypothetical protein